MKPSHSNQPITYQKAFCELINEQMQLFGDLGILFWRKKTLVLGVKFWLGELTSLTCTSVSSSIKWGQQCLSHGGDVRAKWQYIQVSCDIWAQGQCKSCDHHPPPFHGNAKPNILGGFRSPGITGHWSPYLWWIFLLFIYVNFFSSWVYWRQLRIGQDRVPSFSHRNTCNVIAHPAVGRSLYVQCPLLPFLAFENVWDFCGQGGAPGCLSHCVEDFEIGFEILRSAANFT
jgi:hypothetical protein